MLLRSSKDIYLPGMADLFTYEIKRYEPDFKKNGWTIVQNIDKCAKAVSDHTPFRLTAKIELVKTCVYLRHLGFEPPEDNTMFLTLERALTEINEVIREARQARLMQIAFAATLVRARTLNRQGKWMDALKAVADAEKIVVPLPKPLQAEAYFSKGKIIASRAKAETRNSQRDYEEAHIWFSKADQVGHCSLTFRISCRLQIADVLLQLDQVVAAGEMLAKVSRQLKDVEHTFLHQRRARLEKSLDEPFTSDSTRGQISGFSGRNSDGRSFSHLRAEVVSRSTVFPRNVAPMCSPLPGGCILGVDNADSTPLAVRSYATQAGAFACRSR